MKNLQDLCCDSNLGEKVEHNSQVDQAPNEAEGRMLQRGQVQRVVRRVYWCR
jgi:hypothetical protein